MMIYLFICSEINADDNPDKESVLIFNQVYNKNLFLPLNHEKSSEKSFDFHRIDFI